MRGENKMSDKDFYADESKYQRIESLKNQLQCPCCSSFQSDVIEAFHDGSDSERWFGHQCRACGWANALSLDAVIENKHGELEFRIEV